MGIRIEMVKMVNLHGWANSCNSTKLTGNSLLVHYLALNFTRNYVKTVDIAKTIVNNGVCEFGVNMNTF